MSTLRINRAFSVLILGVCSVAQSNADAKPFVPWSGQTPNTSQAESQPPASLSPKLSLQMRISQSGLPIIKGRVYQVSIKYKDLLGVGNDCEEKFSDVIINESVLNLEIGKNTNCGDFLAEVTKKDVLNYEICFGRRETQQTSGSGGNGQTVVQESCFNQILKIASAPAALRVKSALESETAHRSNLAYQSSYTYRVSADHDALMSQQYPAHFSFRSGGLSESDAAILRLPPSPSPELLRGVDQSGFIRWVPLDASDEALNLYFALLSGSSLVSLNDFVFGAHQLIVYGPARAIPSVTEINEILTASLDVSVLVDGDVRVSGDSEVSAGNLFTNQEMRVAGGALVERGGALVYGNTRLEDLSVVNGINGGGLIRSGWRRSALDSGAPTDSINITGGLVVGSQLGVEVLGGLTPQSDQNATVRVSGATAVIGASLISVSPLPNQTNTSADGDDIKILGDLDVTGALKISPGALSISGPLNLDQDLLTSSSMFLSNRIALTGDVGQSDVIVSLADTELGINFDLASGEADHVYDIIRFKGDVTFYDRVDLDEPNYDVPPECTITPARIGDQDFRKLEQEKPRAIFSHDPEDVDIPFRNKLIPDVYEVQCGDAPAIRVSTLRDSVCGNGIREGSEICDLGENNISSALDFYCEPTETPFPNCRFFRKLPLNDPSICSEIQTVCVPTAESIAGTVRCTSLNAEGVCVSGCQGFNVGLQDNDCVIQSESDSEQRIIDACLQVNTTASTLTFEKRNPQTQGCPNDFTETRLELDSPQTFCRNNCTYARCGDGIIDATIEKCDDGNLVDTDDCSNTCSINSSCRLTVIERVRQSSAIVYTHLPEPVFPQIENPSNPTVDELAAQVAVQIENFSPSECLQPDGSVVGQNMTERLAVQRVIELDLELSSWVSIETFEPGATEDPENPGEPVPPLSDTYLYVREQCGQVRSSICNDNTPLSLMAKIEPQLLPGPERAGERKRYYVVVSSPDQQRGSTNVAIKFTCAEQERLVESLIHRTGQPAQEQILQINTAVHGRRGHVQTECLAEVPDGFIQPLESRFDPSTATSSLGQYQVAVEFVLEEERRVEINANSETLDPVLYLKHGCEMRSVVRLANDQNRALCNDNATGNPRFPMARVEGTLPAGVYYVIIDSATQPGEVNLTVSISAP